MRFLIPWMRLHNYLMIKIKTYVIMGRYFGSVLFLYQSMRRNIMEWLIFAGGLILGGVIGVLTMCILQINRVNHLDRD